MHDRLAVAVFRARDATALRKAARKLFGFSILYLFLLFAVLLVEPSAWPVAALAQLAHAVC